MTYFNLLQLENIPIYQQLQIEEALLRNNASNWCIINKGSPPAIVMGISGKADELINEELFKKSPLPLIRRFSGGGTVVVDENTHLVTWIANSAEVKVEGCPQKILNWSADIYREAFGKVDFRLIEHDYAIGHKKCGGNALYIRKGRWLLHTSFLWDYRKENMQLLKMPKKVPTYRQERAHEEFICRLSDHFADSYTFSKQLLDQFRKVIQLEKTEFDEVNIAMSQSHRQSTTYVSTEKKDS